jgi:hypothetical protein
MESNNPRAATRESGLVHKIRTALETQSGRRSDPIGAQTRSWLLFFGTARQTACQGEMQVKPIGRID